MSQRSYDETPIERLITSSQVRKHFDEASIERMAESIKAVGVLQPILARRVDDTLLIVDGERRYRAARLLGMKTVPVVIDNAGSSPAETVERQLIANIQRADLRPTERATAIESLIALRGITATAVAARLGLSGGTVTRLLAILKLPEAIRQQIDSGEIPMSAGYELAKLGDAGEQLAMADHLAEGHVTRDAVSGAVKARRRSSSEETPSKEGKRIVLPLGEGRSVSLSGATSSLETFISLFEELLARARKARTQGWTLSTFLKVARDSTR